MKLYLDSNVFISLAREEIGKDFKLLGADTELFFGVCVKRKIQVIVSFLFFEEIEKTISLNQTETVEILEKYGLSFEIVNFSENLISSAKQIQKQTRIHFTDALHVAIAVKENCDLIISWNKKDFEKTMHLIECGTPKEFIDELG